MNSRKTTKEEFLQAVNGLTNIIPDPNTGDKVYSYHPERDPQNAVRIQIIVKYIKENENSSQLITLLEKQGLLHRAIRGGFNSIVNAIIAIPHIAKFLNQADPATGQTPLTTACTMSPYYKHIIQSLLKVVDINKVDQLGHTALYGAVSTANADLVELLIENKAKLGTKSAKKLFALLYEWIDECVGSDVIAEKRFTADDRYYSFQKIVAMLTALRPQSKSEFTTFLQSVMSRSTTSQSESLESLLIAIEAIQIINADHSAQDIQRIIKENNHNITIIKKNIDAHKINPELVQLLAKKSSSILQSNIRVSQIHSIPPAYFKQHEILADLVHSIKVSQFVLDCEERRMNPILAIDRFATTPDEKKESVLGENENAIKQKVELSDTSKTTPLKSRKNSTDVGTPDNDRDYSETPAYNPQTPGRKHARHHSREYSRDYPETPAQGHETPFKFRRDSDPSPDRNKLPFPELDSDSDESHKENKQPTRSRRNSIETTPPRPVSLKRVEEENPNATISDHSFLRRKSSSEGSPTKTPSKNSGKGMTKK